MVSVAANDPMKTYELDFTLASPQTINLSFQDTTSPGNDDVGPLLDNIVLDGLGPVGASDGGSTVALLGGGLICIGLLRNKFSR